MNKTICMVLFLCLNSCQQQQSGKHIESNNKLFMMNIQKLQYPDNTIACKVIETFLNEYIIEKKLDSVLIIDEVRDWNIEENLEYSFDGESWLPKTEKERQKKLKLLTEPLENSYPYIYAYAYPITDRLFSKADREYIKIQASKNMGSITCIQNSKVKLVAREDKNRYKLSFATPLFTQDSSKIILSVYHDAFYHSDMGHWGRNQYIYYKRDKQGNLKKVFATIPEKRYN